MLKCNWQQHMCIAKCNKAMPLCSKMYLLTSNQCLLVTGETRANDYAVVSTFSAYIFLYFISIMVTNLSINQKYNINLFT